MDELGPALICPACRHRVAYDDAIRTVGGRRYHAACVDAHRGDHGTVRTTVRVVARYVERFTRVLRG